MSDSIADIHPNATQRAGDFQSNTNPQANRSITAAANSLRTGTFLVENANGQVKFEYQFDGGYYEGELGIFSLSGMSALAPGSPEFIAEAARRVLTNSTEGHIVIRDSIEGAKFTGAMPGEGEWGSGEYQGIKTFNMTPGDTFAVMLVPSGTVQSSLQFSWLWDLFPENRPLFSIADANPNNTSYVLPIADATGTGNTFALEDMSATSSDGDYNDLIFTVIGARGNAPLLDAVINPAKEWRNTTLGQQLIEDANSLVEPTEPNDTIVLVEGEIFANQYSQTLTVPASGSILNISLSDINFDTNDPKSINDALEIALVDNLGKSLVPTISPGKNAFFNNTEGQQSQLAPGVTFNGTTISVNLSQIAPGTAAQLQVRLVNNDSDTATRVGINSISIQPSETTTAPITVSPDEGASTNAPVNFASLRDVSSSLEAEYKQTSFNSGVNILYADLAVKNTGQYPVRGTLLVGINNISDPTVRLLDADGITPEGMPYYDITKLVGGGILEPGELTSTDTLKFYNPAKVQFSYDLVFLSQLNQVPEFKATPGAEALVGKGYVYSAIAVDADGDALTYSLLEKPQGMEIDAQTGIISWNPVAGDMGNHAVTVEASDGKGGVAQQKYVLSAINPPPNRPPIFTSTPVVDAAVNTPYRYQVLAKDDDSDSLTFSLVDAPPGMRLDSRTGLLTWAPAANQPSTASVMLRVADGKGGIAEQSFSILTQQEPGNNAPLIISDPTTQGYAGSAYSYSVRALDPDSDSLRYSLVSAPARVVVDENTGVLTWNAPVVGSHNVAIRTQDNRGGADTQSFELNVTQGVAPGEIRGTIWSDSDSDGVKDLAETGLSGVQVYLDRNQNGLLDSGEPTESTDEQGNYKFTNLTPGVYVVREVLPGGFAYSSPAPTPLLGANIIKNGSFEQVPHTDFWWNTLQAGSRLISTWMPHWQVTQGTVDLVTTSLNAASNGQVSIDLNGWSPGGIAQTFDTQAGKEYMVSFDLSANPYVPSGERLPVILRAAGQSTQLQAIASGSSMQYTRQSWQFTANGEKTELEFISPQPSSYGFNAGPQLDNVSVAEIVKNNDVKHVVTLGVGQIASGVDFGNSTVERSPANNSPLFKTQNPPNTATVGELWRYNADATDQDRDALTYELLSGPDGMAVEPQTGKVVWRPALEQSATARAYENLAGEAYQNAKRGLHNVILAVKDDRGGIDLQSFQVQVQPPNTRPIITSTPNQQAAVNLPYQYRLRAQDADGDVLVLSLTSGPNNAQFNPDTGVLTWTPTADQIGQHPITLTVSDNRGESITQTFNITAAKVALPNADPTIISTPRLYTGLNQAYFYNLQADDPNGDPLTYTLKTAPTSMRIDSQGRVTRQPTAAFFGPNPIKISVEDGRGGIVEQEFTLNVGSQNQSQPPSITSIPSQTATVQKLYQYDLAATDPDNDVLLWSLDAAPSGMSIDPVSGQIRWVPSSSQIGTQEVAVRVMDSSGTYVGQAFTLNVRGVNVSPGIISTPPTLAAANKAYNYQVLARDAENDPLTFSLLSPPNGMTINPQTGLIQWTPSESQVGVQNIGVLVSDSSGGTASQQYTLAISETAINLPPAITSTPVFTASPGRLYTYQVTAADADGTISQYQLLESPTGMTINSANGAITWNNPTAGNHQIVVGAVDTSGAGAAQGFELIARANSTPNVPTIPIQSVSPGGSYRYDLKATDANGDLLTFALIQSPSGMTVDEFGRISWKPSAASIGTHPVEVKVTDTFGESVTVSYNLSVVADTVAPKVSLIASNNTVGVGDSVTFTVNAVDNVKVESLGLTINGTPVVLDAQGQANVKLNNLGSVTAVATALDAAGNAGTATPAVAAIDTSDVNAPTINICLEDDTEISAPVNITGTINDSNLAYYTLEVAPVGGGEFKEVYRGTTAVNNGTVATFDPTVLANGAYTLKFTAFDANGNGSTTERTVNVAGDLKLGNFRLSFTDLTVPVAGIPISVTRTYDSLNANASDDFGYGWRMEFRDTDLKTSLKADPTYEDLGINTVPFQSGTKVFVTLPGGKRETFTFKPQSHHLNQYLGAAGPGATMYKPAFESQKGSTMTLTVKDANLVRNEKGYYGVNGQPFNPENPAFGGIYVLTTKEGLVYEIDAASGDLLTATDANGNKLTFSDAGIVSSTGKSVTFERDVAGRIVGVVDPDGKKVKYEYDTKGDLVAVKDREENRTQFKYEDEDRPHFLTEVIDPLGRSGVKTDYDEQGRLKQMVDANGSAVELVYDPNNSLQKVKDVFGKETTYVYDSRGNVLTEIDPLGKRVDRTFDGDNNVLTETVITTELNAAGNPVEVRQTTEWTYDTKGNKLTEKDALGNVSRWTYNSRGQVLTETDALGNTATYTYSPSGNLLSTLDAKGHVTKHSYDLRGLRLSTTDADNKITRYEYDNSGNLTRQVDALSNDTTYTYNNLGKRLSETKKITTAYGLVELVTEWKYDSEGRVKSVIDAEGYITNYEYDANGNRRAVVDATRRRTEYVYNEKGLL